jgi:ribosomal protein S24E
MDARLILMNGKIDAYEDTENYDPDDGKYKNWLLERTQIYQVLLHQGKVIYSYSHLIINIIDVIYLV